MQTIEAEENDFLGYSAYNEEDSGESESYAVQSKTGMGSLSLGDIDYSTYPHSSNRLDGDRRVYSRDEFLYALSSPSSIGAMTWMLFSALAVFHGPSFIVFLNFCIPLFMGPLLINKQMPAQLLPSAQRKFNSIRDEANAIAMKNVQLKTRVSRMQRQEYRLTAVEERFEHLCTRARKEVTKMKHLAKSNANLRYRIKANSAAKQIQERMKKTLGSDEDGKCFVNEYEIDEIVNLMKVFAGNDVSSKVNQDEIYQIVRDSMVANKKVQFIETLDSDSETRDSEREYDERKMKEAEELERMYDDCYDNEMNGKGSAYDISPKSSQRSAEVSRDHSFNHVEIEEELHKSDMGKHQPLKLDPSGQLCQQQHSKENFQGSVKPVTNGTMDRPIDIEKLMYNGDYRHADVE